ncbi:MAG: hypothetical protein LBH61_02840, partial [Dysgonamonadaceae bacterium]|nr:hypothetical protein [Dysgonamonadaceae bacterium]
RRASQKYKSGCAACLSEASCNPFSRRYQSGPPRSQALIFLFLFASRQKEKSIAIYGRSRYLCIFIINSKKQHGHHNAQSCSG